MKSIIVKRELLPSIAFQDKFINAVQLARIVGAIRCNNVLQVDKISDDESNLTLRIYLLLNHAALLFEGIRRFHKSKSNFADLPSYRDNLSNIDALERDYNDPKSFINVVLKDIRNKIAFHFDRNVISSALQSLVADSVNEKRDLVLISGKTELVKDTVYVLADNINISYVLGLIGSRDLPQEERFKTLAKELLVLSGLFCSVIDNLIPDLVGEYCELREEGN